MVVPFVKQLENPDEKYLMDIDQDMSQILSQENLSIDQKVKLYNRALEKFTQHYDPNLFGNSSAALNKLVVIILITKIMTYQLCRQNIMKLALMTGI